MPNLYSIHNTLLNHTHPALQINSNQSWSILVPLISFQSNHIQSNQSQSCQPLYFIFFHPNPSQSIQIHLNPSQFTLIHPQSISIYPNLSLSIPIHLDPSHFNRISSSPTRPIPIHKISSKISIHLNPSKFVPIHPNSSRYIILNDPQSILFHHNPSLVIPFHRKSSKFIPIYN